MSQASRIRLSPLEEQLLDRLGGEWATLHELQRELFPDHAPLYVKAALRYLRQSPEHSELDQGDLTEARAEKERFLAAAGSLFDGEKLIDELTTEELREAIERWRERLSDFVPGSDEARILTLRIETATAWLCRL